MTTMNMTTTTTTVTTAVAAATTTVWCCIITRTPSFHRHNSANTCYFQTFYEIMQHKIHLKWTANVLPLPCNNCIIMTSHTDFHGGQRDDKIFEKKNKRHRAKFFLSELPTKPQLLSGLKRLINRTDETGSIE